MPDHLGSPLTYISQTGSSTSPLAYDPYGGPRPGSTLPSGIGFTGEWANATGLVHLRFRDYDPLLGRFIGRDTFAGSAALPQTGNRFSYALGNPLRYTDPSGHFVAAVIANPGEFASFAVGFTSIPGFVHAGVSAALGYDPISGRTLEPWERTLPVVILAAIPAARLGLQTMRAGARLVGRSILGAVGALRRTGGAIGDFASASRAFGRLSGLDDAVRGIRVSTSVAADSRAVAAGARGVPQAAGRTRSAAIVLDTNALIAAVERGRGSALLAGRSPVVPITAAKEFLRGGGSTDNLRRFLSHHDGRIGLAGQEASVSGLQRHAAAMGRALQLPDARIAASAIRENLPIMTNDKRLGGFLKLIGHAVEGF